MFTGSAISVATWGHQACGIAEARIIQLERDALACSGIKPAGRCRLFGLLITYGVLGTPRARLIRDTIRAWIGLLRTLNPEEIIDLRAAWAKAKETLTSCDKPINNVTGILSNVICILIQAKWSPIAYNVWRDDIGNIWAIVNLKISPDNVATAIYHSYLRIDLARASQHYNGRGIEHGVDFENTFRYPRAIKDCTDTQYQFKSALSTVMAGGCWPASRINSINSSYLG